MQLNRVFVPPILSSRLLCAPCEGELSVLKGASMGTTWRVQAVLIDRACGLQALVEAALLEVIEQMSTWEPSSFLSRFNRAEPETWHTLPRESLEVLSYAAWLSKATQGAYDPTIGGLINAWGFGPTGPRTRPPSSPEIREALACAGWQRLRISHAERRMHQPGSLEIELSSIAKGFAVDQVARALEANGIGDHLVEIGGELRGAGCKPDGSPWWVEIESPALHSEHRALVALHDLSVATSGDYRRFLEVEGRRYSHAIDPRTGWPVDNDLASVTVLARECMHADALATALHILGLEEGMRFARVHHIAAIFSQRSGGTLIDHLSPGTRQYLD